MTHPSVVIACVAEDRPDWYRMVENLAVSVRNFGGRLASAPIVAHFVDHVDDVAGRHLTELGVELHVVERYSRSHPPTNKLRMFEEFARRKDADLLLALDCDLVVARDFLDEAVAGAVTARPAAFSPLSVERWNGLLASLDLAAAASPTVMLTRRKIPAPYVNSGVIFVPVEHADALASGWRSYVDRFLELGAQGVEEPWTGYFLDQIALSCTLLDRAIPVGSLSPYANMPTAVRLQRRVRDDEDVPVAVMHYHKNISESGLLLHTDSPAVNAVVDRINRVIAARLPRGELSADAAGVAS